VRRRRLSISESDPASLPAGGHTFVGPRSTPDIADPGVLTGSAGAIQPFEILVDGDSHGNYPNRQEVITSDIGWQAYWNQIHANIHPVPPLLPVDFNKNQVIALSEGTKTHWRLRA
jgi:hypothetical protein